MSVRRSADPSPPPTPELAGRLFVDVAHAQVEGTAVGAQSPRDRVAVNMDALGDERASARREAARRLEQRGFEPLAGSDGSPTGAPNATWRGTIHVQGMASPVAVRVELPPRFPDTLPRVRVDGGDLPRRVAHVEESGYVCVVQDSGVLVDADRPADLVDEALDRASVVLARGVAGHSDDDLQSEFLAYWKPTDSWPTYAICEVTGPARSLFFGRASGPAPFGKGVHLLADSEGKGRAWVERLSGQVTSAGSAFFIPLVCAFDPPEFGAAWTVGYVRTLVNSHCRPEDAVSLNAFLGTASFPAIVAMSLPEAPPGTGRRLVAVRIEKLGKEKAKALANGFRPGHVPGWRTLQATAGSVVARVNLERVDGEYLRARGGAAAALAQAVVVVVGIGTVGSEIARNLAALGVGRMLLIDHDEVRPENIHRHVLGARQLGCNKATALAAELSALFPHLDITGAPRRVDDLLMDERDTILDADLIVVAVGDETLERRLNRLLAGGPPRLHAWVEPLGVGGHAFACNIAEPERGQLTGFGCFECLFKLDQALGLVNATALTGAGQEIRASLSGCAGTFSPFSALDARRTALEAAELASAVLTGAIRETTLVTWRGERSAFEEAGYRLSARGAMLGHGTRVRVGAHEVVRIECKVCGQTP